MRKEFIDLLDVRRIALGLRKQDLAIRLGVTPKTVSQWYNDETVQLSPAMINKISEVLGIDFNNVSPAILGAPINKDNKVSEYTYPVTFIPLYDISTTRYENGVLKGIIKNNITVPLELINGYKNSFALYIDTDIYSNIGINKGDIVIGSNINSEFYIVAVNNNLQINYKLGVNKTTLVISGVSAHIKKY